MKGMLNDRKMVVRMEQQARDSAIQELNYKITVALNSDSKSEVEGLRWVLTRRAAIAIASMARKSKSLPFWSPHFLLSFLPKIPPPLSAFTQRLSNRCSQKKSPHPRLPPLFLIQNPRTRIQSPARRFFFISFFFSGFRSLLDEFQWYCRRQWCWCWCWWWRRRRRRLYCPCTRNRHANG